MKTVLITGANRGIGLAHAQAFLQRGAQVFAAVRNPAQASELQMLAAAHPGRLEVLSYDAALASSAQGLKAALGDTPLDLLFANAGAMGERDLRLGAIQGEELLELIRVNAVAPLQLAQCLVANVAASQRKIMAFQSSQMGSIESNTSGANYAYRTSKAALNMIVKCLAIELKPRGVIAVALHPGWVKTRMGGVNAPVTVTDCIAGQQRVLEALKPSDTGRFFNVDGTRLPW